MLTVTTTEPRFTRAEVDLLLASMLAEEEPRGAHGYLLSEATDPELRYRWRLKPNRRDFAQELIDAKIRADKKQYGDDYERYAPLYGVELTE